MAHAGTDAEITYRSPAAITADYDRDPLLAHRPPAGRRPASCTPAEVLARYDARPARGARARRDGQRRPPARQRRGGRRAARAAAARIAVAAARRAGRDRRAADAAFGGKLPEHGEPLTLADSINRALADALAAYPNAIAFGEDVGRKGGVYGVTRGLARRFGAGRVFDTLLDEQSILGLGLGSAVSGLLPIPEIQYLAYLHNAEDQLRGEAASLQFFSNGQYRNPMVVRVAGLAYQKGFGGHFHNDNAVGVLRDIPGIVVARARPRRRRRGDAADLPRRRRRRRHGLGLPRADRALPHPRPARAGRRRVAVAVRRPGAVGRAHMPRSVSARTYGERRRPHAGHLRQRRADVAAGRAAAGRRRRRRAGARPALARAAAGRRPAARSRGDRSGAGRRRDPRDRAGSPRA